MFHVIKSKYTNAVTAKALTDTKKVRKAESKPGTSNEIITRSLREYVGDT